MPQQRRLAIWVGMALSILLFFVGASLRWGLHLPAIPAHSRASDAREPAELSPNELFMVQVNGLNGYIDRTGAMRIKPRFEHAGQFCEGLAWASQDRKYGYINTTGEWVIEPAFDLAKHFSRGLAPTRDSSGLYGYIGPDGSWVITPRFESAHSFNADGRALVGKLSLPGRLLARIDAETGSD